MMLPSTLENRGSAELGLGPTVTNSSNFNGFPQTTNLRVGRSNRSGRAIVSGSPCFPGMIQKISSLLLPHWYQAVGSMVRVGMGLIKNEHGVWCVRRKVPKRLEEAVATVLGASKARQPWLKRSLRTR